MTLPTHSEVKEHLDTLFSEDVTQSYTMTELYESVRDEFKVDDTKLPEDGHHSHGKGIPPNELDKIVGFTVMGMKENQDIKLVDSNTYEHFSGPDKEVFDTPGQRSSMTRQGMSYIIPSIKLLRKCGDDDETIVLKLVDSPTGQREGWTVDLIQKTLKKVPV